MPRSEVSTSLCKNLTHKLNTWAVHFTINGSLRRIPTCFRGPQHQEHTAWGSRVPLLRGQAHRVDEAGRNTHGPRFGEYLVAASAPSAGSCHSMDPLEKNRRAGASTSPEQARPTASSNQTGPLGPTRHNPTLLIQNCASPMAWATTSHHKGAGVSTVPVWGRAAHRRPPSSPRDALTSTQEDLPRISPGQVRKWL